jgi:DNA polymerase I-like protein with 3'-5' exonuclease and polymerase domains
MHPQFTFLPDTGRLSSRAPNFQNIPQGRHAGVERDLAYAIRSAVIPTPGYTLVELDWKAIEALLVGWFADDQDYVRICRLDPHSYLAAHVLRRRGKIEEVPLPEWDDGRLTKYLKWIKNTFPDERILAKKNNHAGNYDQGAKNRAKDIGCSVEEAEFYMEVTDAIAPKVAKWKMQTRIRAHEEGRLMNPFGYLRAFFNVFEPTGKLGPDGRPTYRTGKEAWEALAFLPQSTGAAMCREVVLQLSTIPGYRSDFFLLVPIHDSLFLEIKQGKEAEIIPLIKGLMTQKWPELGGLHVDVDVKTSTKSWAVMEEWRG